MVIVNHAEETPFSWQLRGIIDAKLEAAKYTQTEVLNSFMELAVQRETENQFNETITKEVYFTVLHDILTNLLLKSNSK